MLYKIGTVKEIEKITDSLQKEVYQAALNIVSVLDGNYGAERDIDEDDGGFVLIAENITDLSEANEQYVQTDEGTHEYVNIINCSDTPYIEALFLCNNEFGINVFMPASIATEVLLEDLEGLEDVI